MNQSIDNIPPPLKLLRPSQLDISYTLEVVQNPIRARCCGFGEKDRRPIDPPPILRLSSKDQNGNPVDLKGFRLILVYTPWSANSSNDKPEYVRNLIGSSVSNAYHLYNEDNEPGTYFIFHDLSVRTEGTFVLKFVFANLAAGEPLTMSTRIQQEIFSTPFSVYPAKKFPGLTESTPLSKCFSKQGIKIPIRGDASSLKRLPNTTMFRRHQDQDQDEEPRRKSSFTRLPISDFLSPE
ncbi:conserved hypothetical protein [Mucor ambiguus]|uniref:Velvet domain-containing protein n=1 Tax=Mucor ambiguus TaxID=91626 RepID=A0A0C9MMA6_9FUNG|nr:conserved hypothetical protein [Mucor ambiguus]